MSMRPKLPTSWVDPLRCDCDIETFPSRPFLGGDGPDAPTGHQWEAERKCSTRSGAITVRPSGLRQPDAILARTFVLAPRQPRQPSSQALISLMRLRDLDARGFQAFSVTSRYASSRGRQRLDEQRRDLSRKGKEDLLTRRIARKVGRHHLQLRTGRRLRHPESPSGRRTAGFMALRLRRLRDGFHRLRQADRALERSLCSTDAKNASMSTCKIRRTGMAFRRCAQREGADGALLWRTAA